MQVNLKLLSLLLAISTAGLAGNGYEEIENTPPQQSVVKRAFAWIAEIVNPTYPTLEESFEELRQYYQKRNLITKPEVLYRRFKESMDRCPPEIRPEEEEYLQRWLQSYIHNSELTKHIFATWLRDYDTKKNREAIRKKHD